MRAKFSVLVLSGNLEVEHVGMALSAQASALGFEPRLSNILLIGVVL